MYVTEVCSHLQYVFAYNFLINFLTEVTRKNSSEKDKPNIHCSYDKGNEMKQRNLPYKLDIREILGWWLFLLGNILSKILIIISKLISVFITFLC